MNVPEPICIGCNRHPVDCGYQDVAEYENLTPDEYVRQHEGTYNPDNGHFLCDVCYVKAGMPSSPWGWIAP